MVFSEASPELERDFRTGFLTAPLAVDSNSILPSTSVLNPVPLPQPLSSHVNDTPTPITEPSLSDLGFQTIASAALPQREVQRQVEYSLPSIRERRLQLSSFQELELPASNLSRPYVSTSTLAPDTYVVPGADICAIVSGEFLVGAASGKAQSTQHLDLTQHTPPLLDGNIHEKLIPPAIQQFVFNPTPPNESELPTGQELAVGSGEKAGPVMDGEIDNQQSGMGTDSSRSFAPRPSEALWIADMVPEICEFRGNAGYGIAAC
jgi:hypothetical protein